MTLRSSYLSAKEDQYDKNKHTQTHTINTYVDEVKDQWIFF